MGRAGSVEPFFTFWAVIHKPFTQSPGNFHEITLIGLYYLTQSKCIMQVLFINFNVVSKKIKLLSQLAP